ncbi:MAG: hypothetical protein PUE67_00350 [Oscillospiraceae bacterium]|nr:hypothetical protein [Oscillospiraceae bacterium]
MAVIYFIMIFLSLIGIIEIVSYLIYHLMSVKNECSTLLITPVNSDSDYEIIIRSAMEKAKWMGTLRPQRIIIIADGVNEDTLKSIKAMTCGYDYIEIIEKKDREKILNLL